MSTTARAHMAFLDQIWSARNQLQDSIKVALDAGVPLGAIRRYLLEEESNERAHLLASETADRMTLSGPIVEQTEGPQMGLRKNGELLLGYDPPGESSPIRRRPQIEPPPWEEDQWGDVK